MSFFVAILFVHYGISENVQLDRLKKEIYHLQAQDSDIRQEIEKKESLTRRDPVPITIEYGVVLNQIRLLESYSGTSMDVQLEGAMGIQDIASHYESTEYKGVRGLRIRILVDKSSQDTDMGVVLDDIHQLEINTDFIATEIDQEDGHLNIKGEIYGV